MSIAQRQLGRMHIAACRALGAALVLAVVTGFGTDRAAAQLDPYSGQPLPQPQGYNPNNLNNFYMPGPPADTGTATRPSGWPGGPGPEPAPAPRRRPAPPMNGAAQPGNNGALMPAMQPSAPSGMMPGAAAQRQGLLDDPATLKIGEPNGFEGARPIAFVGMEVIQEHEVSAPVNERIEANRSRIPPGQMQKIRDELSKKQLEDLIIIKLGLVDAKRKVPPEQFTHIADAMGDDFDKKVIKMRYAQLKVNSRGDLDAKLREQGSSLEREKQAFIEQSIGIGWINEQSKIKQEITHEGMLAYYLEHIKDYSFPAKARWEELRVRVSTYPSRDAARAALGEMGNAVLRGAKFGDVARARSQGPTAADGGAYDWTSQGSLTYTALDETLFTVPIGQMSPIVDDGRSSTISIVRVLERSEAGKRPFSEVQDEIKEKLTSEHHQKEHDKKLAYVTKLRAETSIWTIYDAEQKASDTASRQNQSGRPTENTTLRPATPASGNAQPANPYLLR